MHFVCGINITIGRYLFTRVNKCTVRSSWKELSDTATIFLPFLKGKKIANDKTLDSLADALFVGDYVTIEMSYSYTKGDKIVSQKNKEFSGFIKRILPNKPLQLECEDASWLLRRTPFSYSEKNTTLKKVLEKILSAVNSQFAGQGYKITLKCDAVISLDSYSASNVNCLQALQDLKDKFNLTAYFNNFQLYVGIAYIDRVSGNNVGYSLAWNVIKSNLEYLKTEDRLVTIKATGIKKDGSKITVTYPENSKGEVRQFNSTKLQTKEELTKWAKSLQAKSGYEGYKGNINTFFIPIVKHSDTAVITDPEFKERDGNYIVNAVETTFGDGIKRKVEIGQKVS